MIPNNVDKIGERDYERMVQILMTEGEDAMWEYLDRRLTEMLEYVDLKLKWLVERQEQQTEEFEHKKGVILSTRNNTNY